jgi:hypothetical protein
LGDFVIGDIFQSGDIEVAETNPGTHRVNHSSVTEK